MHQRSPELFTSTGINTELALRIHDQAEQNAKAKAEKKAKDKKEKYAAAISELENVLHELLVPNEDILCQDNAIDTIIERLLFSTSDDCKEYYNAADIISDLKRLLQNNTNFDPSSAIEIIDQLKQSLLQKNNEMYSLKEISSQLNLLFAKPQNRFYTSKDIAKALNQVLLLKQQVAYAGEEIVEELKGFLDSIVMQYVGEIHKDYIKFYNSVFNWDSSQLFPEDQQKCAIIQQLLLVILENVKETYKEIHNQSCQEKIRQHVSEIKLKQAKLTNSTKDIAKAIVFNHKLVVMYAMTLYLNGKMNIKELQNIASENYLYCSGKTSYTNTYLMDSVKLTEKPVDVKNFMISQPLLNNIGQYYDEIGSIDLEKATNQTIKAIKQRLNVLKWMKYYLTNTSYVICADGEPRPTRDGVSYADPLHEITNKNPEYNNNLFNQLPNHSRSSLSMFTSSMQKKDKMNELLDCVMQMKPLKLRQKAMEII